MNSTPAACLVKPTPIMFLAEENSLSLAVPGLQSTCAVTAAVHTTHDQ